MKTSRVAIFHAKDLPFTYETVPVPPLRTGELLVRNVFSEREMTLNDVGTLVVVGGREPHFPLYEPLVEAGINVERVGDCFGARTTEEAVHEATVVALAG